MNARLCCALALAASLQLASVADAEETLRIGMTASDIPTTTGMPNNGFEGMRFLGYPIFEGLVAVGSDARPTGLQRLRPGLAERWEQAPDDKKTWIFHLRQRREVPRRHRLQCRRGDLESRPLSSRTTVRNSSPPPPA